MLNKERKISPQTHGLMTVILAILMIIPFILVTACQQTTGQVSVQSKSKESKESTESVIPETTSSDMPDDKYPSIVQDKIEKDNLTAYIDAKVDAPDLPTSILSDEGNNLSPEGNESIEPITGASQFTNHSPMGGEYYNLIFTPQINGVKATYAEYIDFGSLLTSEDESIDLLEAYDSYWHQEYLWIMYDNSGLICFDWHAPTAIGEMVDANASLIPFDQVMDIFKQQIATQLIFQQKTIKLAELHVNQITLGLMKIKEPHSDSYIYVPVWDFFGYTNNTYTKDTELSLDAEGKAVQWNLGESFLTINALNGTVINRVKGY